MTNHPLQFHNPDTLFNPTPYGFSHTVKTPAHGELIYISGQSGGEGHNHSLSKDFRRQVQVALSNLRLALEAYDLSFTDIVKITVLIVDHNAEKLSIWSDEARKCWPIDSLPTSTLIPTPALAIEGMQIEVDAIAFRANADN